MNIRFKKKFYIILFKVIIVLSTYTFVSYKIYSSVESSQLRLINFRFDKTKILIFIIVIFLMFINWLFESIKWQILVKNFKKINIKQSVISVLAGISIGIFTPNRIGEFVGRPYFLDSNKITSGVLATIVGSLSQSLTTILFGLLAINLYVSRNQQIIINHTNIYIVLAVSVLLVILISYVFFNPTVLIKIIKKSKYLKKYENELNFMSFYKPSDLRNILSFSILRYIIFFTQFYLLLLFFDVHIDLKQAIISVGLIYLFLFIIPGFALSEIGVRGSLAIFFLGIYSSDYTAIFSASILLWIINLALPAVVGTFIVMRKSGKDKMKKY